MPHKILLDYEFEFIQNLSPELNENGDVIEFRPQESFTKKNIIPLHKYGDGTFCHFSIDKKWNGLSGVYTFYINDKLVYIGKCKNLGSRFNHGYGNISPRNCYLKGQSTNCKLNKVVLEAVKKQKIVAIYFHNTSKSSELESILINHYHPEYNIQIPNKNNIDKIINKMYKQDKKNIIKKIITYFKYCFSNPKSKQINNITTKKQIKKTTQNIPIESVREYIRNCINEAKSSETNEIILRSGDIHKELNMHQAMPTVCNAMQTLGEKFPFEIQQQPPKGYGSNLIIKYKSQ